MIAFWMSKTLAGHTADSILDVGPGYNTFALEAARITGARNLYFLDYSRSVLDWQVEQSEKAGLQAVPIQADLNQNARTELPGPFDLILCQEVLEHLPHAEDFLRHLAGSLAPEGRLVITVPTRISEQIIRLLNPGYMKDEPYGHVNRYNQAGLRRLLASAGLQDEVLLPIQPHYFLAHLWLFGTRVPIEGASGKILRHDWRTRVFSRLLNGGRAFFHRTFPRFWGRCFPRNYFVVARRTATP